MKNILLTVLLLMIPIGSSSQKPNVMIKDTVQETAIKEALEQFYFKGIYEGNTDLLKKVFYKDALVFGDIKGVPYSKTAEAYIEGVGSRISPKESGKTFEARILSIEIINTIASVKLNVKMYDYNYYNFITFHLMNGQWLIVNKTLTDVAS